MALLLAEDDPRISKLLIHMLNKDGFQVDHAKDGQEALLFCELNDYEVLILDWMMPKISGIEVCEKLRASGFTEGILMLTAKDTIDDKIEALGTGADDYLVKPFEYRELLARVKALARRSSKMLQADIVTIGQFKIDRSTNTIYKNDEMLNLSRREYQLFSLFLENRGKTLPKDTIIDKIWGIDGDISTNNLEAFIRLLRKKVEDKGVAIIITVRGIGYKVEV